MIAGSSNLPGIAHHPGVWANLLDLLLPNRCLGCKQGGVPLCDRCTNSLPVCTRFSCVSCSGPSYFGEPCLRCQPTSALSGLWVAADYRHPVVASALQQLKYQGVRSLAQPLAALMERFLASGLSEHGYLLEDLTLVAVPLHRRRRLERGFNQAELIADALTSHRPMPTAHECLARVLYRPPQVDLSAADRLRNVRNAFRAPGAVPRRVLLVDDVTTTGSTLQAAAAALRAKGAQQVWGLVVARG